MGRTRRRQRADVQVRRKRQEETAQAHAAQLSQKAADLSFAFRRRRRQKVLGIVLLGLAPIVFVTHMLEHIKVFQLFSPALEDLTIGFPTAVVVALVGLILLGQADPQ